MGRDASSVSSNSVKKSQPTPPISKIDERLEQYTQAIEVRSGPRLVPVPTRLLPMQPVLLHPANMHPSKQRCPSKQTLPCDQHSWTHHHHYIQTTALQPSPSLQPAPLLPTNTSPSNLHSRPTNIPIPPALCPANSSPSTQCTSIQPMVLQPYSMNSMMPASFCRMSHHVTLLS